MVFVGLCTLLCLMPQSVQAQHFAWPEDSIRYEELVQSHGPGDFRTSARRSLLSSIRQNQPQRASGILLFMARRKNVDRWLTSQEYLLAETLIADTTFLRDTGRVVQLLKESFQHTGGEGGFDDNLLLNMRRILRDKPERTIRRLLQFGATQAELQFFQLIQNAQLVSGVRTVKEMNELVDRFREDFPESDYAMLAARYLRFDLARASFGSGFFLGYAFGGVVGSSSGIPGKSDGLSVRAALFKDRFTLSASLFAARLFVQDTLSAGTDRWGQGLAGMLGGMLDIGYEIQGGDAMITPFVGGTMYRLRQDGSSPNDRGVSTGLRLGIGFGTDLAYRLKFDTGPHLDLGLRLTAIIPGFSGYSTRLDGTLVLLGVSFGFVGRPYTVVSRTGL